MNMPFCRRHAAVEPLLPTGEAREFTFAEGAKYIRYPAQSNVVRHVTIESKTAERLL